MLCLVLCLGCVEDANPALEDDADGAVADAASVDVGPESDIPLPDGPLPRIEIVPPALVFAAAGNKTLRINNIGDAVLDVGALALDGEARAFVLVRDGRNALAGAIGAIEPGDGVEIEVGYRASRVRDEADLLVSSNDPRRRTVRVPMTGGVGARCLEAEPSPVEMGQIRIRTLVQNDVVLHNCGDAEVTVTAIGFRDDAPDGFEVEAPGLPVTLGRGERLTVTVTVELGALGPATGSLVIESDGESLQVQVLAIGAENTCPQARVSRDLFIVPPAGIITLDGSDSIDPGGEVIRWTWVVVERPPGSGAEPVETFENPMRPADGGLEDDTATPTAFFFVDIAGRYVIELQVTDSEGCVGTAQVVVDATGRNGLRLELVWDSEADLDLHLLHPDGAWFNAPLDCFFRNAAPDWGVLEDPSDDPEMLVDDSDGFGPEVIRLGRPQEGMGGPYLVGVHAFGGEGYPTDATLRVLIDGEVVSEATRSMAADAHFWEAFEIPWPEVELRDRYLERRP